MRGAKRENLRDPGNGRVCHCAQSARTNIVPSQGLPPAANRGLPPPNPCRSLCKLGGRNAGVQGGVVSES